MVLSLTPLLPVSSIAVTYVLLSLVCGRNISRRVRFLPEASLFYLYDHIIALFCSFTISYDLQHSDTPLSQSSCAAGIVSDSG